MIPENIYHALKVVVEKLSNTDVNWVLVGSTNLAIQGVGLIPNDIDLLTDKEGAYKAGSC